MNRYFTVSTLALATIAFSFPIQGQDRQWTNTTNVNNSWSINSNWDDNVPPDSTGNAFFLAEENYEVLLTSDAEALDLDVRNGDVSFLGGGFQLLLSDDLRASSGASVSIQNTSISFTGTANLGPIIFIDGNSSVEISGGSTIITPPNLNSSISNGQLALGGPDLSITIDGIQLGDAYQTTGFFGQLVNVTETGELNLHSGAELTTNTVRRYINSSGRRGIGNMNVSDDSVWYANGDSDLSELNILDNGRVHLNATFSGGPINISDNAALVSTSEVTSTVNLSGFGNAEAVEFDRVNVSQNATVFATTIDQVLAEGDGTVSASGNIRSVDVRDNGSVTSLGEISTITVTDNALVAADVVGSVFASKGGRINARTGNLSEKQIELTDVGTNLVLDELLVVDSLSISDGATSSVNRFALSDNNHTIDVSGNGSAFTVIAESQINLGGSEDYVGTMSISDGAIVSLQGELNVGGDFISDSGSANVFFSQATISVSGGITLWNRGSLVLNGGSLSTATVIDLGGTFDFQQGVLTMTDSERAFYSIGAGEVFDSSRQLHNAGRTIVQQTANLDLSESGVFSAGRLTNLGSITVSTDYTFGSSTRFDGYQGDGLLTVDNATLTINDANVAELGRITTLRNDATIAANKGFLVGNGFVLEGQGTVNGKVTAGTGSLILSSGGSLTLGDGSRFDGFSSQGELRTGTNTVALLDANQALLGSLTEVGGFGTMGQLVADNGLVINAGNNLIGYGQVDSINSIEAAVINDGFVSGNSANEHLTFTGYVKGVGTFENVTFDGTFNPGHSPAELHVGNLSFSENNLLIMELAGLQRGDEFDALVSDGLLTLDGELRIELIEGFDPMLGNSFDLLDWNSVSGEFEFVSLPTLDAGLAWDTSKLYSTGVLSVTAVPEPGVFPLMVFIGCCVSSRRRRTRR